MECLKNSVLLFCSLAFTWSLERTHLEIWERAVAQSCTQRVQVQPPASPLRRPRWQVMGKTSAREPLPGWAAALPWTDWWPHSAEDNVARSWQCDAELFICWWHPTLFSWYLRKWLKFEQVSGSGKMWWSSRNLHYVTKHIFCLEGQLFLLACGRSMELCRAQSSHSKERDQLQELPDSLDSPGSL